MSQPKLGDFIQNITRQLGQLSRLSTGFLLLCPRFDSQCCHLGWSRLTRFFFSRVSDVCQGILHQYRPHISIRQSIQTVQQCRLCVLCGSLRQHNIIICMCTRIHFGKQKHHTRACVHTQNYRLKCFMEMCIILNSHLLRASVKVTFK